MQTLSGKTRVKLVFTRFYPEISLRAATKYQYHSSGYDLVAREHKAFGAGFHITSEYYPVLGQGTFGHSGAGGQQAFADPRNGLAYGYTRRRFPFPSGAAPENDRLIRAVLAAASSHR